MNHRDFQDLPTIHPRLSRPSRLPNVEAQTALAISCFAISVSIAALAISIGLM